VYLADEIYTRFYWMINEAAEFDTTIDSTNDSIFKNVLICDTQPVAVEGMKWLIKNSGDLRFAGAVATLDAVYELLNPEGAKAEAAEKAKLAALEAASVFPSRDCQGAVVDSCTEPETLTSIEPANPESSETEISAVAASALEAVIEALPETLPETVSQTLSDAEPETEPIADPIIRPLILQPIDAVVIDKGLGLAGVMELLQKLTATSHPTPAVVWGAAISEAEALRLLQAGARGILRRTSESGTLLTCLRAVTAGGTWMEDGIFGSTEKLFNPRRSQLTHREGEVVVLVEKGLRNSDIARMLGIRTGTVKIHLKHIFEKTGVRGRYGLAFTGLQNKGSITLTAPRHFTA
jgi:DNA-binding NarL/FixJ family response regulator